MATCEADSTCKITCTNGCYAIRYSNGTCKTGCSGSTQVDISASDKFSIQISDMAPSELARIFGDSLSPAVSSLLKKSSKPIELKLTDVSLEELSRKLQALA